MTNNSGVICIKANTKDNEGLRTFANQISQISQSAAFHNINVVDVLITNTDARNLVKQLKKLDEKEEFTFVLIYSPTQICASPEEYRLFVAEVKRFGAAVCYNRTPY